MLKKIETVGQMKKLLAHYNDSDLLLVELPDGETSVSIQGLALHGKVENASQKNEICLITAMDEA